MGPPTAPNPTTVALHKEGKTDPAVQKLLKQYKGLYYYPRLIYDITTPMWLQLMLWTFTTSESEQEGFRKKIGKVVVPQDPDSVIVCLSVRTCFDSLLRALELPRGSEVIWSGISIPQMRQISDFHHLTSRAFDIDLPTFTPDLEAAEKCFTDKTRMLVIAPVFGRPMKYLKELMDMAKKRNVLCILDVAQCISMRDELVALNADVTFFSFGSIKYATALNGGLTVIRERALADKVRAIERALPNRTLGYQAFVNAKNGFIHIVDDGLHFGVMKHLVGLFGLHIGELANQMSRGFPGDQLIPQIRHRPRASTMKLLLGRLAKPDTCAFRLRCISGWDFLSRLPPYIQVCSGGDPKHPDQCSFWLYPMNCRCPQIVSDVLQENGFDAAMGTSQMSATGDSMSTPQVHEFIQHVLYIPVYPEMSEAARTRMIQVLHQLPRKYVESPSKRFHEYVASRPEKHAYRSAEVAKLLANRPKFRDNVNLVPFALTGATLVAAGSLIAKL